MRDLNAIEWRALQEWAGHAATPSPLRSDSEQSDSRTDPPKKGPPLKGQSLFWRTRPDKDGHLEHWEIIVSIDGG